MTAPLKTLIHSLVVAGLIAGPLGAAHAQERLEDRLGRIERILDSGVLAEMVNQMEQMRRELQLTRGDLEVAQRELEELKRRQRDLYQDSDRRLRQLETAQQQPPSPQEPAAGTDTPVPVPPLNGAATPGASGSDTEWEAYQAAFSTLRAGRYADAAKAFEAFLEQHPQGRYVDNALYWLGESYYVVRNFDKAQPYFQRVVGGAPTSSKRSDAMLKIGFIHYERGEMGEARKVLEKLRQEFPDSTAANLARQRLQRMQQEGR